jgi:hypothetical protein
MGPWTSSLAPTDIHSVDAARGAITVNLASQRERHLDCRPSLPIPVRTRSPHGVRIPMNAPLPV